MAPDQRTAAILAMQQQHGNRYTRRMIAVQRAAASQSAPMVGEQWQAPFGLGAVSTRHDAVIRLDRMVDQLFDMRSSASTDQAGPLNSAIDGCKRQMGFLSRETAAELGGSVLGSDLSAEDLAQLQALSQVAVSAYGSVQNGLNAAYQQLQQMANTPPPDMTDIQNELSEKLHMAFALDKMTPDMTEQMRKALLKTFLVQIKIGKVTGWARDAAGAVGALMSSDTGEAVSAGAKRAGKAEAGFASLKSLNGTLRDGVLRALQAAEAVHALKELLLEHKEGDIPGVALELETFQGKIDLIDAAMPFLTAIPLLSDFWFDWYSPVLRKTIKALQQIFQLKYQADHEWNIEEMEQIRHEPNAAPLIPESNLALFMGGQPVFNFMYGIMRDAEPVITPEVEQFFIHFKDRFNIGVEKHDQLRSKGGSHWYNPVSWGKEAASPNLMEWVTDNKQIVWAQLYGRLNPNL